MNIGWYLLFANNTQMMVKNSEYINELEENCKHLFAIAYDIKN